MSRHTSTSRLLRVIVLAAATVAMSPAAVGMPPGASGLPAAEPDGDGCLGGVCLGMAEQELLRLYGTGRGFPPEAPFERCYRARAKSTFVKAVLDEGDPERTVTAVLASIEPTCRDAGPARLGQDWAGCRGIRLFDPLERLRTVGAIRHPSSEKGGPWDDSPPEVARFDYRCEPDRTCSARASAFVRGRTIIAIAIGLPDC